MAVRKQVDSTEVEKRKISRILARAIFNRNHPIEAACLILSC